MNNVLNVPEIFGCDVFNEATMKERLPEKFSLRGSTVSQPALSCLWMWQMRLQRQ